MASRLFNHVPYKSTQSASEENSCIRVHTPLTVSHISLHIYLSYYKLLEGIVRSEIMGHWIAITSSLMPSMAFARNAPVRPN